MTPALHAGQRHGEGSTVGRGLVAVTDGGIEEAGAMTYWSLSGEVKHGQLAEAWQAAGLDPAHLPDLPTPRAALGRAVAEVRARHRLSRRVTGGWAIVEETEREAGLLRHEQTIKVGLDLVGRPVFEAPGRGWDNESRRLMEEIRTAFERALWNLSTGDVGGWLSAQVYRLGGIALRDTGGFYFVPHHSVEEWRAIVRALRASRSAATVYEIPALRTEGAVDAILAAVEREAAAEAGAIEEALEAGDMGVRALRSREAATTKMERKLASYESMLGRALPALQARLETVRAGLATAILAAEAEEAK